MKKTAFTLVELIVVITILAVLGTIAFLSFQGYSQRAKNTKVSQDLNALKHKIEISMTKWATKMTSIVRDDLLVSNGVIDSQTITLFDENNTGIQASLSTVTYNVGNINFQALRQTADNFKDSDENEYIIAAAYSGSTAYYQIAWQQRENSWDYLAIIKWNYIAQSWDAGGLISWSWSNAWLLHHQILDSYNLY